MQVSAPVIPPVGAAAIRDAPASVNGTVLLGFICLLFAEYSRYPAISHGSGFLALEGTLLAAVVGRNFLGGVVVWGYASR
jgi:hypothetical protein